MTRIKNLKKGDKFSFNDIIYTVYKKFRQWQLNDDPYLITICGEVFYFGGLEVKAIDELENKKP